ncbi:AraC-like ligand binding domain-containing protein [Amycolatopsis arida]|uniref:AraC-like ligand binding domain-containing protein n=1 Tax=Amycolatopsis arida TaxID=587909 RepID=A0A1I5L019_9PSEU|nr:AraC family transcriptional regulator [Amycolatopsis arida]TDX85893.1 AraC-like protein [Amycolatopsis arida]SFO90482.1 AraC-like ligand binding domain-containing protein [Amycolatopsis arida]
MRGTTVLPGTPCRAPRDGDPPVHRLEVPTPTALPFAIGTFDSIGPMSRAPFPHRHTFHEIVHVTAGTGTHVVDVARWELRPPHLGVLAPGQVHHWEGVRDLTGFVVLFTDDFLLDHPEDRDLLRRLSERPWLALDEAAHRGTARLIAELDEEYRRRAEGAESVLRALLHVLVVRAARLAAPAVAASPARPGAVAAEFARLTDRTDLTEWSVRGYAERIGVTPGHLTEAVRAATGRTPSQLLREARVAEAKRLLVKTALTVRQVAGRLDFADPAYFCRFFRRETGVSPGDFRRTGDRHWRGGDTREIHHD